MGVVAALGQLADLAEAQQGLVTARQADVRGVPRRDLARLVQAGGLERVAHGVYRVVGAPRPVVLDLRAAWLQLAPGVEADRRTITDGVVSHVSAATVYGVGLLEPLAHEFTVPPPRRLRSRRDDVVIYRAPLADRDVDWVEEVLVTVPARIVADLCAESLDGEHLAGLVADLLDRRLADRGDLAPALAPYAARYGFRTGDDFLAHLLAFAPDSVE